MKIQINCKDIVVAGVTFISICFGDFFRFGGEIYQKIGFSGASDNTLMYRDGYQKSLGRTFYEHERIIPFSKAIVTLED